jgi:hypothetical protein
VGHCPIEARSDLVGNQFGREAREITRRQTNKARNRSLPFRKILLEPRAENCGDAAGAWNGCPFQCARANLTRLV